MARCFLYVPGHRADRFAKAFASGADAVILDLEDAVPVPAKDEARRDVRTFLDELAPGPVAAWVRINDGDRGRADLQALASATALAGVVVPKATPDVLATRHADAPDVALIPLVESAVALTAAAAIAASAGVQTLAIGEVDLAADLGLGDDVPDAALWALRMHVVVACAAAGRSAPLGPVIRDIEDLAGFATTVRQLRHAGFGAIQAIHPKQVSVVNDELTPTPDDVAAAERLLEAAARVDGGVFVDDAGRMIDEAVLRSARRTLGRVAPRDD
jgi:citrate lyase subunit beta/citryl-CoA lyase